LKIIIIQLYKKLINVAYLYSSLWELCHNSQGVTGSEITTNFPA